jgi:hypothetical protein
MASIGRQFARRTGIMLASHVHDPFNAAFDRAQNAGIPGHLAKTFVFNLLAAEMHAKRVESVANAVAGITVATSLTVQTIGHGLAQALGKKDRHAIKQVDRLLSNAKLDVWALFPLWVQYVLGGRDEVLVALDWTDFEPDDHVTCAAHVVTSHGRATPLVWKTVPKSQLRDRRNLVEDEVIEHLHECVPPHVRITVLADRAFGDRARYEHLTQLGWDYVIRFRECILVHHGEETKPAAAWVPAGGRARRLDAAKVTGAESAVGAVVCVKAKRMKEAWCLATNRPDSAAEIIKLYGRRFTIEETFRDQKDLRFGLGLAATHIRDCGRRDRLLFLSAIAHALLTLLGAASEALGYDRMLKANTSKRRTHSLFTQGALWFAKIPMCPEPQLLPLLVEFERQVTQHALFRKLLGVL